jgi:hypothetical protein
MCHWCTACVAIRSLEASDPRRATTASSTGAKLDVNARHALADRHPGGNRRGVAKPRQQDRQALVDTVAGAARCA